MWFQNKWQELKADTERRRIHIVGAITWSSSNRTFKAFPGLRCIIYQLDRDFREVGTVRVHSASGSATLVISWFEFNSTPKHIKHIIKLLLNQRLIRPKFRVFARRRDASFFPELSRPKLRVNCEHKNSRPKLYEQKVLSFLSCIINLIKCLR